LHRDGCHRGGGWQVAIEVGILGFLGDALLGLPAGDEGDQEGGDEGGHHDGGCNLDGGLALDGLEGGIDRCECGRGGNGVTGYSAFRHAGDHVACLLRGPADAVPEVDRQDGRTTGEDQGHESEENTSQTGGEEDTEVNAGANGEGDEGDDQRLTRCQEVTCDRRQVAQGETDQHRQDRSEESGDREVGEAGGTEGDHGEERSIGDGEHRDGTLVRLGTELLHERTVEGAIRVGHGRDDGQGQQAEENTVGGEERHGQTDDDGDAVLGHQEDTALLQCGTRGLQADLRTNGQEEEADQDCGAIHEQGGGEAADIQNARGEGIDQGAEEEGHHHQCAGDLSNGAECGIQHCVFLSSACGARNQRPSL